MVDYAEGLRENCCSAFAGILQAMCKEERGKQLMRPYLAPIWHLIIQVATARPACSDQLCASALGLVGDMLIAFGVEVIQAAESEQVLSLMSKCRRSKNSKAKTVANWVTREAARVKRTMNGQQSHPAA